HHPPRLAPPPQGRRRCCLPARQPQLQDPAEENDDPRKAEKQLLERCPREGEADATEAERGDQGEREGDLRPEGGAQQLAAGPAQIRIPRRRGTVRRNCSGLRREGRCLEEEPQGRGEQQKDEQETEVEV